MFSKIGLFIGFVAVIFIEKSTTLDPQYTTYHRRNQAIAPIMAKSHDQPLELASELTPVPIQTSPPFKKTLKRGPIKKVIAQIIKKYRLDQSDGSILWGYENDDGSFKEEVIGFDCITRGKYGYTDPEGKQREFTYRTGVKCEKNNKNQTQTAAN